MIYSLSPGLVDTFPSIDDVLGRVRRVACKLDRDICVRDLRVEAQRNTQPDYYKGYAFPLTRLNWGRRTTYHRDGLIELQIGSRCKDDDIIRLYAHELRHIGQFHRGRRRYGSMTVKPMDTEASEADAQEFEIRVLDRV